MNEKPGSSSSCARFSRRPVMRLSSDDDLVAAGDQRVAEVRADETRPTGDDDAGHQRPTPVYAKPRRRSAAGIEQVAGVDDRGRRHRRAHAVEVEPAELVPLGEHREHVRAVARLERVADDLDRP